MNNLQEVKEYFDTEKGNSILNEAADYMFVKSVKNNVMFQFSNGEYKFYKTFNGFCKAVLWRIKRG